jgi:hypothetical protein
MTFPKIDLEELKQEKKRNTEQRRDFAKKYAEWLKKTPNKIWSKQQNKMLNK